MTFIAPAGRRAQLGATPSAADLEAAAVARAHADFARAHGWVATRMPPGQPGVQLAQVGQLAYRTTTSPPHRYALAPFSLRQRDAAVNGALIRQVQAGKVAAVAEQVARVVAAPAQAVLSIPREAVRSALGVPPWAATALLAGGGLLAVAMFARAAGGGLTSLIPRRANPPRRRRRPRGGYGRR